MPQIRGKNSSAWALPKAINVRESSGWVQRIGRVWTGSAWVAFITYFSNAWETWTAVPSGRVRAAGAWSNQYIHVVGGEADSSPSNLHRRYNPITLTWDTGAGYFTYSFSMGRGTAFGDDVYVNAGNTNAYFSKYNNNTNSWTALSGLASTANILTTINSNTLFRLDGAAARLYNISTNTWTSVATMDMSRTNSFGETVNGKVYISGGANNSAGTGCFDPVSNSWSYGLAMTTARFLGSSGSMNGMLICAGGSTSSVNTSLTTGLNEGYSPLTNSWTTLTSMPSGRSYTASGTSQDGKRMFVAMGYSSSSTSPQPSNYVFT